MKIIHTVEFYEPHKGGAEEVVKQLSEGFVKRGHKVIVLTTFIPNRRDKFINGVEIESFKISGNSVRGIKEKAKGEISRYQDFLLKSNADIILNYAAQTWTTDLTLPLLDNIKAKKILVPCGYSGLTWRRYKEYYSKLPSYLKKYDKLVYMSDNYQDKIFGDEHGLSSKAVIIPNGAGREFLASLSNFRKRFNIKTPYLLLNVSNHYVSKGHKFIIDALKLLKRRDVTLIIIGEKSNFFSRGNCYPFCKFQSFFDKRLKLLTGVPRKEVISAFQEADLFLFGSKIECAPLVMYESFASKTLFITTEVGNVSDHREIIRIVKTPKEMAEVVDYFLNNPQARLELVNAAFRVWQNGYTWDHIIDKYEKLYRELTL